LFAAGCRFDHEHCGSTKAMKATARLLPWLPLAMTVLLAACAAPPTRPVAYRARVENVGIPPGDYYSPAAGCQPMTHLLLRVVSPDRGGRATFLRVEVLGWYVPETLGRPGDAVVFEYPGPLPRSGWVGLDGLRGYRVVAGP
jgi:hypothetical protein